jgi:hypothetical protein
MSGLLLRRRLFLGAESAQNIPPQSDMTWSMRAAVDRDHPDFVEHFMKDGDQRGCLDDAVIVVASSRERRHAVVQ